MATYTTVSLANQALLACGASPITALTDDTPNARALNEVYETAKKSILVESKWNFSVTRTTLATVSTITDAAVWRYPAEGYAYDRPTDRTCLRIWNMDQIDAIWREEGDYIIADRDSLGAIWTYDHSDPSKYTPKFAVAFIHKLASDICFMILHSINKGKDFLSVYKSVLLPEAMAENSQTGVQQEVIDDAWTSAKYEQDGNPSRSYGN